MSRENITSFVDWLRGQLQQAPTNRSASFSPTWDVLLQLLTDEDKRLLREFSVRPSASSAQTLVQMLSKYDDPRLLELFQRAENFSPGRRNFGEKAARAARPNGTTDYRHIEDLETMAEPPAAPQYSPQVGGSEEIKEPAAELNIGAADEIPVTCHFTAQTDAEVATQRPAVLEVIVSREVIAANAGASAAANAIVDPAADLVIEARGVINIRIEGESKKAVQVPSPGHPENLLFNYRATHDGVCTIAVDAWQHQKLLLSIELSVRSVAQPQTGTKASAASNANTVKAFTHPPVQLRIRESSIGEDYYYQYEMYAPELGVFETYDDRKITGDRKQYIANLYRDIEKMWKTVDYDADEFQLRLRSFGAQLFVDLFPEKLQQLLFTHGPKISSITVMSTEPFIPWELLLVRNPDVNEGVNENDKFLCEYGLVRWLYKWTPAESLIIRSDRARYLIPTYLRRSNALKSSEEEKEMLIELFDAKEVTPGIRSILALFERKGSFDLLHFCCHGAAADGENNNSELLVAETDQGNNILPVTLSQAQVEMMGKLNDSPEQRPVVFVNACQAGRMESKITSFGGFAQAFLLRGAGMFVAALWNIEDRSAVIFARELYKQLLNGKTLSQAAVLARLTAKENEGATWLAYTVYGHPDAKLIKK